MRVAVDLDTCQGNALCMSVCPEVFDVDDQGVLHVLTTTPDAVWEDRARLAALECPTQAITVED